MGFISPPGPSNVSIGLLGMIAKLSDICFSCLANFSFSTPGTAASMLSWASPHARS